MDALLTSGQEVVKKCSFCGLPEHQVGLYGGPQVMICTECVRVMYEDIGPVEPTPRSPSDRDPIVSVTSTRSLGDVHGRGNAVAPKCRTERAARHGRGRPRSSLALTDGHSGEVGTPEQPLDELQSVGVEVSDVWDLVNAHHPYAIAIPILLDWLEHLDERAASSLDAERLREGLVRALTVRDAEPAAAP